MKYLIRLGKVTFSVTERSYKTMKQHYIIPFGVQKTINSGTVYQKIGAIEKELDLDGELVMKGNLKDVIQQSIQREPQLLITGYGETLGKFLVTDITTNQSSFFADGTPRRSAFSIKLKQDHSDGNS